MMKRRDFFRILKSRGFGVALSGRGTFLLKEKCPKETSACGLIPCENRRGGFFHPPSGGAKLTTVSSHRNASADSTVVQTTAPRTCSESLRREPRLVSAARSARSEDAGVAIALRQGRATLSVRMVRDNEPPKASRNNRIPPWGFRTRSKVFASDGVLKTPNALKAGKNSTFDVFEVSKIQSFFCLVTLCCIAMVLMGGLAQEAAAAGKSAKVLVSSPKSSGRQGQSAGPGQASPEISVDESIAQLCAILDRSGEMWQKIQDRQYKIQVLNRYIDRYQRSGVIIRKSAESYVSHIDDMAAADPKFLSRPFPEVLKMVAVIEYDFGNGEDPDAQARKLLGEKGFRENKKRFQSSLGQVYQSR